MKLKTDDRLRLAHAALQARDDLCGGSCSRPTRLAGVAPGIVAKHRELRMELVVPG
jgi:hypothetical protein